MKTFYKHTDDTQRGTVLFLVILVTGLLTALSASFADSIDNQIDTQRDEGQALRAEFAAESGWEFAQRQLLLNPNWTGTAGLITLLDGMTKFDINTAVDESETYSEPAHNITVDGIYSTGLAKLGGTIQVTSGANGTSEVGLILVRRFVTLFPNVSIAESLDKKRQTSIVAFNIIVRQPTKKICSMDSTVFTSTSTSTSL